MRQEVRDSINNQISKLDKARSHANQIITEDFESAAEWDKVWNKAIDNIEIAQDELEFIIDTIWYRNLDQEIQRSCNYYRKKAGLKPWPISAIM